MRPALHRAIANRPGLTLIEALAAVALLSLVASIGGSWLVGAARAGAAVSVSADQTAVLARTLEALRGNLAHAGSGTIRLAPEGDELSMTTTSAAPGAAAGWREVRWFLEGDALTRTERLIAASSPEERLNIVLRGAEWSIERVESDGNASALSIELTLGTAHGVLFHEVQP